MNLAKSNKRNYISLLLLFCLFAQYFATAEPVYACSCGLSNSDFESTFTTSSAVFRGTVTNVYAYSIDNYVHKYVPKGLYRFLPRNFWWKTGLANIKVSVSESWKGVRYDNFIVYREFNGSDCTNPFMVGEEYLFYARSTSNEDILTVLNCYRRTHEISHDNAQQDLLILQNYPQIPLQSSRVHNLSVIGVITLILFGLVFFVYNIVRKT